MTAPILCLIAIMMTALAVPAPAAAEPADIEAAARGVVRLVIVEGEGDQMRPVSHGTGFAVSPTRIVTNAHVVMEARMNPELRIAVVPGEGPVPGDGAEGSFARLVQISARADLALVEIAGDLRLPPLTLSGIRPRSGEATAVGYPMNVDRAQGLEITDIVRSQPPVASRGFISGERPSREFDTLLHTAPIARGNSGGPLLDNCGRVLGVNSFGADSEGADGEFYFAVSNRELLPFLAAADIEPRVNAQPCRTLADLDAAERERAERQEMAARAEMERTAQATRNKRERALLEATQDVQATRENRMALALVALLAALGLGGLAWRRWSLAQYLDGDAGDDDEEPEPVHAGPDGVLIAFVIGALALFMAAIALWFTRPGLDAIDRQVAAAMADTGDGRDSAGADGEGGTALNAQGAMNLSCRLQPERSRITGAPAETVDFSWSAQGCVNGRTQYGQASGAWSRVFVPNEEAVVSVNRFDPASRTYTVDRYLLTRSAMVEAREARGAYSAPSCESDGASAMLGDLQGAVVSQLPEAPNERLVYACEVGSE